MTAGLLLLPSAIVIFGPDAFAGSGSLAPYPAAAVGGGLLTWAVMFSPRVSPETPAWVAVDGALIHSGGISYGLHVRHVFAYALAGRYLPLWWIEAGFARTAMHATAAFLLTVARPVISYQWQERPILKRKQRFTAVRSAPI